MRLKASLDLLFALVLIASYYSTFINKENKIVIEKIKAENNSNVNNPHRTFIPQAPSKEGPKSKTGFYHFTNPANYRGTIIRGWPPLKSRDVSRYVRPNENTVLSDISCLNISTARLLIAVQSNPSNPQRRRVNRKTWMRMQNEDIKTIFVFGKSRVETAEEARNIEEEQKRFCDLVQMDFIDDYQNVSLDSISAIKFALSLANPPEFLAIADDDVFVNVPSVHRLLFESGFIANDSDFLIGHLFHKHRVKKVRNRKAKYTVGLDLPSYMVKMRTLPDLLDGGFYILPFGTLKCLYESLLYLPLFVWNDIFVTGFAAARCGYKRLDSPGFIKSKFIGFFAHYISFAKIRRSEFQE